MFERGDVEFSRVLAFSDGLFAIAMTLLVVGITVPTLSDPDSVRELADALNDLTPAFTSFFISFFVIGRYWVAHHAFFSTLRGLDRRLMRINLVYLAFVAFLPFPTALLGELFDNPLSVVVYAVTVAMISGLEVVQLRHAHRAGLVAKPMPEEVYRFSARLSLAPVLFFMLSVPIAFASTTVAVASWFLMVPLQVFSRRWRPAAADDYRLA